MQKYLLIVLVSIVGTSAALEANDYAGSSACVVCHNNMPAAASVHDEAFAGSAKGLLPKGNEAYHCEACHGPSKAHAQRQSGGPWRLPPAVFSNGHDATVGNAMCSGCHAVAMEGLDAHARSFHATAERNELGCNRCHGGVAHGLPDWVVELSLWQKENETR